MQGHCVGSARPTSPSRVVSASYVITRTCCEQDASLAECSLEYYLPLSFMLSRFDQCSYWSPLQVPTLPKMVWRCKILVLSNQVKQIPTVSMKFPGLWSRREGIAGSWKDEKAGELQCLDRESPKTWCAQGSGVSQRMWSNEPNASSAS